MFDILIRLLMGITPSSFHTIKTEYDELQKEAKRLTESKNSIMTSLQSCEEEIAAMTTKRHDLEKAIKDLRNTQASLEAEIESRKAACEAEVAQMKTAASDVAKMKNQMEQALFLLKEEQAFQRLELQEEARVKAEHIKLLNEDIEVLELNRYTIMDSLSTASAEYQAYTEAVEAWNNQVAERNEAAAGLSESMVAAESQLQRFKYELEKAQREREQEKGALRSTLEELTKIKSEVGAATAEKKSLQNQMDKLKSQLEKQQEEGKALEAAKADKAKAESQLELLRKQAADLEENLGALKKECEVEEKRLKEVKETGSKAKVALQQQKCEENRLTKSLEDLRKRSEKAQKDTSEVEQKLSTARATLKETEAKLTSKQQAMKDAQLKQTRADQIVAQMRTHKKALTAEIAALKEELQLVEAQKPLRDRTFQERIIHSHETLWASKMSLAVQKRSAALRMPCEAADSEQFLLTPRATLVETRENTSAAEADSDFL